MKTIKVNGWDLLHKQWVVALSIAGNGYSAYHPIGKADARVPSFRVFW